jgi:hypothetical protein
LCRLRSERLRVVEGFRCGAALDADHRRGVEHALELAVEALPPVQVAGAFAGIVGGRGQAGVAGQVVGGGEPGQGAAGGGEEFGSEQINDWDPVPEGSAPGHRPVPG